MFLCTYCLEQKVDAERSDEHVVGAALGGTWTVNDVCETCQRWAATEIDEPFSQMLWTLEKRHRLRIPDRYGKVPLAPHQDVTLGDGRKGRITISETVVGISRSSRPEPRQTMAQSTRVFR